MLESILSGNREKPRKQERLIRELINGGRGGLERGTGGSQERWEEGRSSGVLVGKEVSTQGEAGRNESVLFTVK